MAEDQEPSGPSLEPPSLFRRKKKDPPPTPAAPPVLVVEEARPEPPAPAPEAPRVARTGPVLSGQVAAAATGLLVGAVVVGLTTASFELCSAIQGTNSCGGPGFLLLVAILVVAVVLGTAVLRFCQVPEPGSTSFLAVGLTGVIALLFLVDALFEWWMVIAIPLVSVATFLLSHWVTTTFVEPAKD